MGVLVFLLFALMPLRAEASMEKNLPKEVIFDPGNPDASVGVVGEELLELGSLCENYRVTAFDASAIIVKEPESDDSLKWFSEGKVPKKIHAKARRLFIVKQLKLIYQAQVQYLEKFQAQFATDLNTLIDQGFLSNGFNGKVKEGYSFRILNAGEAKLLAAQFKREPIFTAVAEPLDLAEDPYFFSVDQLGQVRYAKSLQAVTWGPVWDYGSVNEEPPSTVITHKEAEEE